MSDTKVSGRFSKEEDKFISENYLLMTDEQIAKSLGRSTKSITNRREKLGLMDKQKQGFIPPNAKENRSAHLATLGDKDRADFLRKEFRASSMYQQSKKILDADELAYYEEKYIDFMMDPTIETLTSMERDAWHDMTMARIRKDRYMKEEKTKDKEGRTYSKSKEIRECDETIDKCRASLNVERRQRLKNSNDQAANFTSIIRELTDPNIRREAGIEACMLKFISEKTYNDQSDSDNPDRTIFSGRENVFNIGQLFKGGTSPSGLSSKFI